MSHALTFTIIAALAVFALPPTSYGANPGDACTTNNAVQRDGGRTLICNGTVWKHTVEHTTAGKSLFQIGNDTGACNTDKGGRLRFDGSELEICDGTAWVALAPAAGGGGGGGGALGLYKADGTTFLGSFVQMVNPENIGTAGGVCEAGVVYTDSTGIPKRLRPNTECGYKQTVIYYTSNDCSGNMYVNKAADDGSDAWMATNSYFMNGTAIYRIGSTSSGGWQTVGPRSFRNVTGACVTGSTTTCGYYVNRTCYNVVAAPPASLCGNGPCKIK